MARRGGLTVKLVENLQARASRYEIPDPGCAGLYLAVHPSGAKSWCFRYRIAGKSRKLTIGAACTDKGVEVIKIGDARDVADEARVSVARRIDPIGVEKDNRKAAAAEKAAAENTLRAVAKKYLGQQDGLRSIEHRRKTFERLIYPALGDRPIESIKRSEIVTMLDDIAASRGVVMADYTLATLRRLLSWHAARADDYVSPIIRGMSRTSTTERSRKRTLSEIELKAFWRAADDAGMFGLYLQFLLLTATRRNEAAHLSRSEIEGGDWTIPGSRYKTKIDHLIPMSTAAVAVLDKVPKIGKGDFVFTPDGRRPLAGFGCRKEAFDAMMLVQLRKIAEENGENPADVALVRWTIHDLRRTARTLMSQAGIAPDHAEAALGHIVRGVEGTYNRYQYRAEKKAAFAKLAGLIDRIINPIPKVVPLHVARRGLEPLTKDNRSHI
jgi:integrase